MVDGALTNLGTPAELCDLGLELSLNSEGRNEYETNIRTEYVTLKGPVMSTNLYSYLFKYKCIRWV